MIVSINGSTTALYHFNRRLCIISTDGSASSRPTALHRLNRRLCTVSINGSTSSRRMALHRLYKRLYERLYERLYNGSAITRIVAHTTVRTNGSISSLRRLYERPRIVSTNSSLCMSAIALHRLYDGSTTAHTVALQSSVRTALHRLYERLHRLYKRLCNGSATALRMAL